jgi:hypothetical protein
MKNQLSKLDNWVIDKIKTEYKDDVALLIGHNNYRLDEDKEKASFSFFFPAAEKALGLSKTFIIGGTGYDLFPMSWERIERMAALDEDNASCVDNAKILYNRTEEDKKRFLEIQDRLKKHLKDPRFMLNKALEKLDTAMGFYQTMMFEVELYKVRKAAGYITAYLSNAVAYANLTYLENGHCHLTEELAALHYLPMNFIELREMVARARSDGELKKVCYELIANTRLFLSGSKEKSGKPPKPDFASLADWYQELSYTWREIYYWCERNDAVKSFMRGCFLQTELDIAAEEFGLGEIDLMGAFDAEDLPAFRKRAAAVEKQIVDAIESHGAAVERYNTVEEFLEKNG